MTVINGNQFMPPVQGGAPEAPPSRDIGQEEFLQLLMTQMGNQDPLNPMKTEEFMNQITAMNSLQQQIATNSRLDELVLAMGSLNNETAVNLVGKSVVVAGNTFPHEAGADAPLQFELAAEATDVSVVVTDAEGRVVRTLERGETPAGSTSVSWDGLDDAGNPVPSGDYSFRVTAKDGDEAVPATTFVTGVVEELRFDSGAPQVVVGGQVFDLAAITRVTAPPEPSAPAGVAAPSVDPNQDVPDVDPQTTAKLAALQNSLQALGLLD